MSKPAFFQFGAVRGKKCREKCRQLVLGAPDPLPFF